MRIGILSPITIQEFIPYLDSESQRRCGIITGLLAPSIDVIVHEFLKMGHEVVLFTLDTTVKGIVRLTGKQLSIYIGEYRANARTRGLTFFYKEIRQLRRCVSMENCDIVHAHWTYEFALGALRAKCPIVITVRDSAFKILKLHTDAYRLTRWLMDWIVFARNNKYTVIANSLYMEHYIKGRTDTKVNVIFNSVNEHFIASERRRKKSNIIVTISNGWSSAKNGEALLMAFPQICAQIDDAELWIVGSEQYEVKSQIEELIKNNNIELKRIRWFGKVPHQNLPQILQSVDLMIHPSLEESFGNTLIEAMALGIPVIGGVNSGAVPWVVDYGKSGVLCDVTSPDRIAESAIDLLTDINEWNKFSEAGRQRVIQNFTAEAVAKQTINLYKQRLGVE